MTKRDEMRRLIADQALRKKTLQAQRARAASGRSARFSITSKTRVLTDTEVEQRLQEEP